METGWRSLSICSVCAPDPSSARHLPVLGTLFMNWDELAQDQG
jgi:hypothetical protein